ncbi:MAG: nicotinate (nicotinamide) nucleotide adenylyltransferase [Elusimicrobia bacterium]|nr:nicotinate (nicotinamide) nucleotide adenylyltransferase [Elusimicrobiota bacterium]
MFDPPHIGHMSIAREAVRLLDPDKIIWIPSANPPHRKKALIPARERFLILSEWAKNQPNNEISSFEIERSAPGYTVDTLSYYKDTNPDAEFFILIGSDQAACFSQWKNWRTIIEKANLCVAGRPGGGELPPEAAARAVYLDNPPLDISSTEIREKILAGQDLKGLVEPEIYSILLDRKILRGLR